MTRAILSISLCIVALGLGVLTAVIASKNRARAADLDRRQHWCETFARQNDVQFATNDSAEWQLLRASPTSVDAADETPRSAPFEY